MTFAEPLPKKQVYKTAKIAEQPATLAIETIDVSDWDEFTTIGGGTFFDKADIRSTIYQSGAPRDMVLNCSYFSVISTDKQTAIATLRRELLVIKNLWPRVKVVGFLAKPSVIELKMEAKPNETADAVTYVDLRGPVPAVRKWAAFCFLFAYEEIFWDYEGREGYRDITVERWKTLGIPSAVREGEVGKEVPATLNPIKVKGEPVVLSEPHWDPLAEDVDLSDLEPVKTEPHIGEQNLTTLQARGETKPAPIIGAMHPEIKAAADKHGIDLNQPAGRELQEMRKYFGSGSGLYIATVDFQTAQVNSTLLTEEAQKRIFNALKDDAKPKRKRKTAKKQQIRRKAKRLTRRRSRR